MDGGACEATLRIGGIHELRAIYANNQDLFRPVEKELRGLSPEDVEDYIAGMTRFLCFYRSTFQESRVPLPDALMMHGCSTYLRLKGIPNRAKVLEIGPGMGSLPLFYCDQFGIECYDQLEVTQSMYIAQSLIGRYRFGHRFAQLAMELPNITRVGSHGLATVSASKHRPAPWIEIPTEVRSRHYPWWRVDDAFENRYDVIIANHCLAEMKASVMMYYAKAMARCLSDDGVLLIQGLGSQRGEISKVQVVKMLSSVGFRPLIFAPATKTQLSQFSDNILAVKGTHPQGCSVLVMSADKPRRGMGLGR